jgi:hypothetical protein
VLHGYIMCYVTWLRKFEGRRKRGTRWLEGSKGRRGISDMLFGAHALLTVGLVVGACGDLIAACPVSDGTSIPSI